VKLSLFTIVAWPFIITALTLSAYNFWALRAGVVNQHLTSAAVVIALFGVGLATTGLILQLLGIGPHT
jgi:hypothetical protein